jgi:hypothetical protein
VTLKWFPRVQGLAAAVSAVLTVAAFHFAYIPLLLELDLRINFDDVRQQLQNAPRFLKNPVRQVTTGKGDIAALLGGGTDVRCYEPLLNNQGNPQATWLTLGSIGQVRDGAYNVRPIYSRAARWRG